jgi:hypothetical protein
MLLGMLMADSLIRQIYLPDAMAVDTPLYPSAVLNKEVLEGAI